MNKWVWGTAAAVMLVLMTSAASAEGHGQRKIIVEGFRANESSMSLQLNVGGLTLSDDAMDIDGSAHLGGMNFNWRWDLVEWGGIEFAFGGYGRSSDDGFAEESRSTVSLAWMWYFARHYHHRFYGITGFGSVITDGTIYDVPYSYSEGGLMLGLGSEWLVSRHWLVSMDVRAMLLSSENEDALEYDYGEGGDGSAEIPTDWTNPPQERTAMMFNLGIGYRW